ncbi:MAG TPA: dihydrolipoyl dehydrogenase [Alphaproteobacteria bacterium]|nr:dihydrolipoyl dehydrogenase [Alphaproteobacteria bacterium]HAJ46202.1 dihydrolipoyl dehydrogenase [Alphaproteobacteria bacterium]
MSDTYDVIVIGGGPGGYNAANRAGQLKLRTLCIEKRATLGGTCLNIGCIPSKALLHASEAYEDAKHHFAELGVVVQNVAVDLPRMMAHKDKSVDGLTKGVEFLFRKNKVEHAFGTGRLRGPNTVEIVSADGTTRSVTGKAIIIATGSEPMPLPGVTIDEQQIVTSTGALSLSSVPGRMVVIGGGYIGLEMGSVWRRLGTQVTVVEYLDRITPGLDGEVAKHFQRILAKQGMAFKLGSKVTGCEKRNGHVQVTIEPAAGGTPETIECDVVLSSIGRRPYTEGLGLDTVGLSTDNRGRIPVDRHYQTSAKGIYAIGDVIAGPMLAHKAEDEAVAVAEIIAGQAGHVNYDAIPAVVYTAPEVASVGKTEEELKAAGIAFKIGKFPFTANSRARVNASTDGFAKVLADATTDQLLGVHIIGPEAGNMIAEAALAIEFKAAAEDIARTSHAHPTLSEAVRGAAQGVGGWAMQM